MCEGVVHDCLGRCKAAWATRDLLEMVQAEHEGDLIEAYSRVTALAWEITAETVNDVELCRALLTEVVLRVEEWEDHLLPAFRPIRDAACALASVYFREKGLIWLGKAA